MLFRYYEVLQYMNLPHFIHLIIYSRKITFLPFFTFINSAAKSSYLCFLKHSGQRLSTVCTYKSSFQVTEQVHFFILCYSPKQLYKSKIPPVICQSSHFSHILFNKRLIRLLKFCHLFGDKKFSFFFFFFLHLQHLSVLSFLF